MQQTQKNNEEFEKWCNELRNSKRKWDIDSFFEGFFRANCRDFALLDAWLCVAKEHGIDLNGYNSDGETLLTLSAHNQSHPRLVVLTSTEGIDVNKCNKAGKHPCQCCRWHGDLQLLERHGAKHPDKQVEAPVPQEANFNDINVVALSSMLATYVELERISVSGEESHLKAYALIRWYLAQSKKTGEPFCFDRLVWYYYNASLLTLWNFGDTETDEEYNETRKVFMSEVERLRAAGNLVIFTPKEETEKLQRYAFTDGFNVSSSMTHRMYSNGTSELVEDSFALVLPNKCPELPFDNYLFRTEWQ